MKNQPAATEMSPCLTRICADPKLQAGLYSGGGARRYKRRTLQTMRRKAAIAFKGLLDLRLKAALRRRRKFHTEAVVVSPPNLTGSAE